MPFAARSGLTWTAIKKQQMEKIGRGHLNLISTLKLVGGLHRAIWSWTDIVGPSVHDKTATSRFNRAQRQSIVPVVYRTPSTSGIVEAKKP